MPGVAQAKHIDQLMVLTAWVDGSVDASEALAVHEIVAALPGFKDIGSKTELSKAVKARIDEKGAEAALRETAVVLTERADQELAFRCCAKVLASDRGLGIEDSDA